ncbi:dynamin family protein [Bdellovibrionota bacterium FG-1]
MASQESKVIEIVGAAATAAGGCLESLACKPLIDEFNTDLETGLFTIVIVGEFNRGKSTFVNALLGQNILPVGPTPTTTTLNVVRWASEAHIFIHKTDGAIEKLDYSEGALDRFTAEGNFDARECSYLELAIPNQFLRQNLFIVDTPGVQDLNEQRSEVAARYIPRADVVIFLLDATAALRKSEQTFLEDSVLRVGLDRVVFILNHIDRLAKTEDRPRVIETACRRLHAVFGREFKVLPLSAKQALAGKVEGKADLLASSGIGEVERTIGALLETGSAAQLRSETFQRRGSEILSHLIEEVEIARRNSNAGAEELKGEIARITRALEEKQDKSKKIAEYVQDREREFIAMTCKSVNALKEGIRTSILEEINAYSGPQFKEFIENRVPSLVRRGVRQWLETHGEALEGLLANLAKVLAEGLQREFQNLVQLKNSPVSSLNENSSLTPDMEITVDIGSNSQIFAGGIAAIGAIALAVCGVGFLFPIVSMVGFPQIRELLLKNEVTAAKSKVIPAFEKALDEAFGKIEAEVTRHIHARAAKVRENAEGQFFSRLKQVKASVEQELAIKSGTTVAAHRKDKDFEAVLVRLTGLRQELVTAKKKAENSRWGV